MRFHPFGDRFEVKSQYQPSEVKAVIRSRRKGWFEVKNGARGWIVGPFICLWFSSLSSKGPMLFGTIAQDTFGSRVRGRAGSDLNGVVMFTLLIPFMVFILMMSEGSASSRQLFVFALLIFVGGPLVYWSAHKDRRQAEPLIRFLRDALTTSGATIRTKSRAIKFSKAFTVSVSGEDRAGAVTSDVIHDALRDVGSDCFVVLASGSETYMQTAFRDGGYILEMREGGSHRHFQGLRKGQNKSAGDDAKLIFSFEEVREAFLAYGSAAPTPPFLMWRRMNLAG